MKHRTLGHVLLILIGCLTGATQSTEALTNLRWYSFDEGMMLGNSEGKKIFIYFWADWCRYCHVMERETFKNHSVVSYLEKNFIAIKVDSDREIKISNMFKVRGLPDNWFFSENGEVIGHRPGYIPPDAFMEILKSIVADNWANY